MQHPAGALGAAEAWFVRLNQWLVIALMGTMAVLVFANVVSRYVFNASMIWVEELTQYQMIWITYLGAGLALREGRHVAIDLLEEALAPRWRRALRTGLGVLLLAFLATLAVLGVRIAQFAWDQETPVLQISAGIPYLGIPIGAAVCGLHLACVFRDFVAKRYEHAEGRDAFAE
jgi:TRAP-type C4-dicarboxylate transport system permease small subunit